MNDMFKEYPDLINVDMLCDMLNIGKNSAYKLLQAQEIKNIRIGREYKIAKKNIIDFVLAC